MSGIAVFQPSLFQVVHADEHGDKHAGQFGIQAGGYLGRFSPCRSQGQESARGQCHEERGGHAFTADITDTEIELVAFFHKVVQVAAHLLGRGHRGIHIEALHAGKHTRHHRHLNIAGNAQFTLHAFFGSGGLFELVVGRL